MIPRLVLRRARRACGAAGIAGLLVGCAGMAAMLPGGAAAILGAVGVSGSSAFARTLSPVAQPLFAASALLVVVAALACSRLVSVLALSGSALLYLSMFELASGGDRGHPGAASMAAMTAPAARGTIVHADVPGFYAGVVLLVASFALSFRRRRRHDCKPVLRLRRAVAG